MNFFDKYQWYLFLFILFIAAFIRFFNFPEIPAGFNQDEAAIAYDSYSIMHYGIDRNGYHFPVYPISWGAGQGPFYMYFAIPFMWLFGSTVFGFRIGNVILSIVSVISIFFAMKNSFSTREGIIAMFLFAISPWNIILSRWALDANPLPSLFIISFCCLTYAINTRRTLFYLLAAGLFAVSLYTYGTSYVVIPLFLLLTIPYLLLHKKITWQQTLLSGIVFVAGTFPLILFILVNYLGLGEINTPLFSVPKLTALRSDAIFRHFTDDPLHQLKDSLSSYFTFVIGQKVIHPWNGIRQFGILYPFSSLFIIAGIAIALINVKFKTFHYHYLYCAMFFSCSVLTLLIHPNVNRIHIVYVPVICLAAAAIAHLSKTSKLIFHTVITVYLISFLSFCHYYIHDYNEQFMDAAFYESYEEAIQFADAEAEGTIYVSSSIGSAYIRTLFHVKTDPYTFIDTVQYYDDTAAFRQAYSFGCYIFALPESITPDAYYVISNEEIAAFDPALFSFETFQYFTVAYPH